MAFYSLHAKKTDGTFTHLDEKGNEVNQIGKAYKTKYKQNAKYLAKDIETKQADKYQFVQVITMTPF